MRGTWSCRAKLVKNWRLALMRGWLSRSEKPPQQSNKPEIRVASIGAFLRTSVGMPYSQKARKGKEVLKWKGVYFAEKLTERQRSVYGMISSSEGKTHKEIIERLALPPRTIRHAISVLRAARLIVAQMSGSDLRSPVYFLSGSGAKMREHARAQPGNKSGMRPFASQAGGAKGAV